MTEALVVIRDPVALRVIPTPVACYPYALVANEREVTGYPDVGGSKPDVPLTPAVAVHWLEE
jgi:hypothetical protein